MTDRARHKHWSELEPPWLWGPAESETPQPLDRQIKRMIILESLGQLGGLMLGERGPREAPELAPRIESVLQWIGREAIDELTDLERGYLDNGPLQWSDHTAVQLHWKRQAAATVAWSLGLCEWRAFDDGFREEDLPIEFGDTFDSIRGKIAPRPYEELVFNAGFTRLWLWRSRAFYSRPKGFFERRSYDANVRRFVKAQEKCGALPPLINDDLVCNGIEFSKLDADRWSILTSNCEERLRAINWVIGEEDDYDEVTNDT